MIIKFFNLIIIKLIFSYLIETCKNIMSTNTQTNNFVWNIRRIFKYKENYQEHCSDGVIYFDCVLLKDFGPFETGHTCNIYIDSSTNGYFTMRVGCNGLGHGGELFVP